MKKSEPMDKVLFVWQTLLAVWPSKSSFLQGIWKTQYRKAEKIIANAFIVGLSMMRNFVFTWKLVTGFIGTSWYFRWKFLSFNWTTGCNNKKCSRQLFVLTLHLLPFLFLKHNNFCSNLHGCVVRCVYNKLSKSSRRSHSPALHSEFC
jgi:hypothetical protein